MRITVYNKVFAVCSIAAEASVFRRGFSMHTGTQRKDASKADGHPARKQGSLLREVFSWPAKIRIK